MEKYNFSEIKEKLYSSVITDVMDTLGYRNQAMDDSIRPLKEDDIVVGRAFTVLATDVQDIPAEPYKLEFQAVDNLSQNDVLVIDTNKSTSNGFWGELLTNGAIQRGAVGAILDGMARDTKMIKNMNFSLFLRGRNPLDSKGRSDVMSYQVPVKCGGVIVNPGDIVYGDCDGIAVIPSKIADKVFELAFEKVEIENKVRDAILSGATTTEVFEKYHVL